MKRRPHEGPVLPPLAHLATLRDVEIDIAKEPLPHGVTVRVQVRLSGRESSRLFLSGDSLIQLPLDGALAETERAPLPRTSIYLSELVGIRRGLTRTFGDEASANSFAAAVRTDLETALEAS